MPLFPHATRKLLEPGVAARGHVQGTCELGKSARRTGCADVGQRQRGPHSEAVGPRGAPLHRDPDGAHKQSLRALQAERDGPSERQRGQNSARLGRAHVPLPGHAARPY